MKQNPEMAKNLLTKYVWLINLFEGGKRLTLEDINEAWLKSSLSEGVRIPKRTFFNWRAVIEEMFGVVIECETRGREYRYYIDLEDDQKGDLRRWLISTFSVCNALSDSQQIKDRIILEHIPSGQTFFTPITEAMKENRFIHISYYSYWREDIRDHYLMPLCVKLFRQRWYMVGRTWPANEDVLFCLDRITDFRLSSHTFEYPKDFRSEDYFDHCFGIIADKDCKVEDVVLKVSASQANYLRDLPMMQGSDQQEIEQNEDYSIFKIKVRPTFDFQQELLWNREELEVLEPIWLRKEIARVIKKMWNKYNLE